MSKVRLSALLLLLLCVATTSRAQTENLLQNPNADLETQRWRTMGQASVEESNGNRCFVVRNGGYFYQDMALPESAVGKYAPDRARVKRANQPGWGDNRPPLSLRLHDGSGTTERRAYL